MAELTSPPMTAAGAVEAWRVARRHCTTACFAYHASWKLFCRANVKGQPDWHREHCQAAVRALRRPSGRMVRILVAGAADDAMLRLVHGMVEPPLEILVVDQCRTPLELSRIAWAESGLGRGLGTLHCKVQDMSAPEGSFDLIVTDGILSFARGTAERERIVDAMHRSLVPGGVMSYSTRVTRGGRPLEYDRVGRAVQALTGLTWPGSWRERTELARRQLRRRSRTSEFDSVVQLRAAFGGFGRVEVSSDASAPSPALRVHPNFVRGVGSVCVRVLAVK